MSVVIVGLFYNSLHAGHFSPVHWHSSALNQLVEFVRTAFLVTLMDFHHTGLVGKIRTTEVRESILVALSSIGTYQCHFHVLSNYFTRLGMAQQLDLTFLFVTLLNLNRVFTIQTELQR